MALRITNHSCFCSVSAIFCCVCHAPVQLDEMVPWNKSAGSRWRVPSEDLGGRAQSHVDQRAPVAYGGTWAADEGAWAWAQDGPQCPGSPLVSEVPQVTDPHPHIRATPAGVPVCTDPTHPRSHRALQVFGSGHAICSVLTLGCCQQWLAAATSAQGLTAGKAEKTQRNERQGELPKSHYVLLSHRQAM